jgi:3-hydroxyisobutyrate dehydrogenase-like beta-hydroxyacid dehydrogenase
MTASFIGLGQMGKCMAANMLKKGEKLVILDVNKSVCHEMESLGAVIAPDAQKITESGVIFLSLPNEKVVEDVIFGENGFSSYLKAGDIIVDLSTIHYFAANAIHDRLAEKGIAFMDAPVSGMISKAVDGTLTIMCGGEEDVFERVKPLLELIGRDIVFMGKTGSGQLTKLVNQMLYNINVAALAEILPMTAKLGLDCERLGQVLKTSAGRSGAADFFIPFILKRSFNNSYSISNAYKDMICASEISVVKNCPMPVFHAALSTYQIALAKGFGNEDKSAMIRIYEELLGVEFKAE